MERLVMKVIRDILYRLRHGQSEREIARDLHHSRVTVHRYHQLALEKGYLDPAAPLPAPDQLLAELGPPSSPPRSPSTVEPYRGLIETWLDQKVEQVAIHQRLVEHHGYTGSYSSVRRFVHHLCPPERRAGIRIETPPGREVQIDFGTVGRLLDRTVDRLRTVYAFVMTLGFSRHQYLEFVFDQTIPTWIGCHRRAFESFGGVPRELVVDNLKAAVLRAAMDDTVLSSPYRQMAQHYGCLIHPCRPASPQEKGKVENGVHYVQRNFWAGQEFFDLDEANRRGRRWVLEIAGVRDHGTTHEAPLARFHRDEVAALLPLPLEPFGLLAVRTARVHRDCHVTVEGSYYSAPHGHVGTSVEVHLTEGTVQLYDGLTLLVTHPRASERGQRITRQEHYPREKAIYLERTPEVCRDRAARIGPSCEATVEALLAERPLDQLRGVQSLVGLEEKVGRERLEAACLRALHYGDPHYRRVKAILSAGLEREPLSAEEHGLPSPPPEDLLGQTSMASPRSYLHARGIQEFFPPELFARECPELFERERSVETQGASSLEGRIPC